MGKHFNNFLKDCENCRNYCKNERKKPNNEFLNAMFTMFWLNCLFGNNGNGNGKNKKSRGNDNGFY